MPSARSRPTPLFWWSGGNLARDKLLHQLDALKAKGIGGTIVGYSHLPDGGLDHGDPAPFTEEWWQLFRWFVSESAKRGMSVGIQDYGVIGPVLVSVAAHTAGKHAGSLSNETQTLVGNQHWTFSAGESAVLSVATWRTDGSSPRLDEAGELPITAGSEVSWTVPDGEWTVSIVLKRGGHIGLSDTEFDPLHPASGQAVIDAFYNQFATRLGEEFGRTFTTFFQDELDLGLTTPMWNDDVAAVLTDAGFAAVDGLQSLWHDRGPETLRFRALYRDTVVHLLETHYFEPIYRWNDRRGVQLVMDQLSRGDLRLGHRHYSDFMQTMKWYHGPGNDDPDLTAPRGVGAFRLSASIAHLHDRPLVVNEAFHSSGWGVSPRDIVHGANIGFVSGANHLILHGLYYTTEGGWWEWAAPDFHYRQPWWEHSDSLWLYLARASELLRSGRAVSDVAIIDPTQDLDLTGEDVTSPGLAQRLLVELGAVGVNADLVPMDYFAASISSDRTIQIEHARYRAVIVPGIHCLRDDVVSALRDFWAAGGTVIVVGHGAESTESRALAVGDVPVSASFDHDTGASDIASSLAGFIEPDVEFEATGIAAVHREVSGADLFFLVNVSSRHISTSCSVRVDGVAELWDLWDGLSKTVPNQTRVNGRTSWSVSLSPGDSMTVVVTPGERVDASAEEIQELRAESRYQLAGPWVARIQPTLDNRFGDFEVGAAPLGVETWRLEAAPSPDGPWRPGIVRDGARFFALGPVPASAAGLVAARLAALTSIDPHVAVAVDGSELEWRPYRFSLETGIDHDPLLGDRLTGPHGLKGVPREFLDPAALDQDPPAGSAYFFWSSVDSLRSRETLTVSTRAQLRVWVGGSMSTIDHPEQPAQHFEPWGLLNLTSVAERHTVDLVDGHTSLLVELTVSEGQPTRAAVVLGGEPDSGSRARLEWWNGEHPARQFRPHLGEPSHPSSGELWFRATVPPGSGGVVITTDGRVASARVNGVPVALGPGATSGSTFADFSGMPAESGRLLEFEVESAPGCAPDFSALLEPLRWMTGSGSIVLADWSSLGLSDFSGIVRYSTTFELSESESMSRMQLVLDGLVGTAEIEINGARAPIAMIVSPQTSLTSLVRAGTNKLTIEVANTLSNYYDRVPSPFAAMQEPSGGFTGASLVIRAD